MPHNGRMPFDSSESRRAAEFDSYRRELVMHSRTVSGEARELWFERLKALVEALFPETEMNIRKPGLATRLYSIEVSVPNQDKYHLLDMATELDDNWRAQIKTEVKGGASCVYRDRLDAIWEFVADLGDSYVTGHVKLRNFSFHNDATPPPTREPWGKGGDRRPPKPQRPYGQRPWTPRESNSEGGGEGRERPEGGERSYDRPYERSYDRPKRPFNKPGGRPPFKGGSGRPKRKY